MSRITTKILLLTAVFFFLALYTAPSFCNADPYVDKLKLKSTVKDIISAIMEQDVDSLMELSKLSGSFQYDKERYIRDMFKDYFNKTVATGAIEVKSMDINNEEEKAEVKVLVHLVAINIIDDTLTEPRHEVWNFVKGKKGSKRGKWILVFEQ